MEAQTQTDTLEYQSCSNCETDFFCPICQDTEKCILVLPICHHKLHSHCALPWFGDQMKDTCPICREPQPPSFIQSFKRPAAVEQRRSETLQRRLHMILDHLSADMGNTPREMEINMQSTIQHLGGLSRWIQTEEERSTIEEFRDNLRNMLPSNQNLLTEDPMSQDDSSSSEEEEWRPPRPVPTNEDGRMTTRSIVDQRTRHIIDNLNIALSNDRNGMERALTHSLRQLSRLERLEMDHRNRLEIQQLRRSLIDRLPSSRPNELVYYEGAVQEPPPPPPQRVVQRRLEGRTLRRMARNPYVQTPVRTEQSRDQPRVRLFQNESDTIQIVDVWSVGN